MATTSTNEYNQYARVRELKASVAANMPTWDAPADAPYNDPDRASYETACLLEAIVGPNYGHMADITCFGDSLISDYRPALEDPDPEEEAAAHEQDTENFTMVLETAMAVERRLKYLAEWVPPQGMEYIRREAGLKLVEMFETLARNYWGDMHNYSNAARARAIAKGEDGGY